VDNDYPEKFATPHNRRPLVRVPIYHDNEKVYLEIQYCPETEYLNVIKVQPQMKEGTKYYAMLVEMAYDLTAQLQSYSDVAEALSILSKRSLRKSDGSPITVRGAILDKLLKDPNLETA